MALASNFKQVTSTDETCFTDCWWVHGRIRCRNCPYITVERGAVMINHPIVQRQELEFWAE